jgi:hypothetical protein
LKFSEPKLGRIAPSLLATVDKSFDPFSPRQEACGEEPDPLMPEVSEKAIREMPRDAEVIDLLKKLSGEARFPRDDRYRYASRCVQHQACFAIVRRVSIRVIRSAAVSPGGKNCA